MSERKSVECSLNDVLCRQSPNHWVEISVRSAEKYEQEAAIPIPTELAKHSDGQTEMRRNVGWAEGN